jgi:hypothetical protein
MIDEQLYSEDSPVYQALKKLVKQALREVLAEHGPYQPLIEPWYLKPIPIGPDPTKDLDKTVYTHTGVENEK